MQTRVLPNRLLASVAISLGFVAFMAKSVMAADVGTGLVAVEDGDDRLRPAAVLHFASAGGFISRAYAYGRDYGPVRERNYILSMGKRFDIASKTWQGHVSAAMMSDTTELHYPDNPEDNTSFTSTNVGMAFGIHWLFIDSKVMQVRATWDSHVFPAGAAFIYLATARKSTLGLTAGIAF